MQKNSSVTLYTPAAKRPWLWLVLVGFLWLQFAGVVHKNMHTDLQLVSSQLEQILPDHSQQNKSDCQLLDLQCFGLALSFTASTLALPDTQTVFDSAVFQSFFQSTPKNYQARAPPKTSI
jgi:hypothetical protein